MKIVKFFAPFLIIVFVSNIAAQVENKVEAEKLQAEAEELFKSQTKEGFAKALPKYEKVLEICKRIAEVRCQASAINRLSEISYLTGEMQKALSYAQTVLPLFEQLGDRVMTAETLSNIGGFSDALGDSKEAITYTERALIILREIGDKKREAVSLSGLGVFHSNLGEMKTAAEYLNSSLVLRREVKDRQGEARTLINLGTVYDDTGELRKAVAIYLEALKIAREEKDVRIEGSALNNLGISWRQLGDYQRSFDIYDEALKLRRRNGDQRGEAITLSNIAAIYSILGDYPQAISVSEQTLEIFQKGGYKRNEAITLGSLSSLYSMVGDEQKALDARKRSLDIYASIGDKSGQSTALRNLGLTYSENNQPGKASELLGKALELAEGANDSQGIALTKLTIAKTFQRLNDNSRAEENYSAALALSRKLGNRDDIVDALYHYALFNESQNQRAAALEKMSEVLRILEDLRNTINNEGFRIGFFSKQQKYYDFYVSLLVSRYEQGNNKEFAELALFVSEKARARSLLDSLNESRLNNNSGVSRDLIEREKTLRQKIKFIENKRQESAGKYADEKAIGELIDSYWKLRAEIRKENPQFASLIQPEAIAVDKIRSDLLDENTVLLEYVLGSERSYLFFVGKTSIEVIFLPNRVEIEKIGRAYIDSLKAIASNQPAETSAERSQRIRSADANRKRYGQVLSKILLGGVSEKIGNKRLLIVGSGILQYIPFAALENQSKRSRSSYLIETNEIVNLPSASVMSILREKKRIKKDVENTIGIIADPVFSKEDARFVNSVRGKLVNPIDANSEQAISTPNQLRNVFSRLRFSRTEAEEIARLISPNRSFVSLDFGANLTAAFSLKVQNARYVHFATHGMINSQYPELSAIVLSMIDENGNPQDGLLQLHDIYSMRLNADVVVLSACESALGKDIRGEGMIGLTRGFMYAGAQSVVASLWKVEDRATAELMKRFYRAMLKDKLPPAQALRKAQVEMIRQPQWKNPFYWAAFTLQGEWK